LDLFVLGSDNGDASIKGAIFRQKGHFPVIDATKPCKFYNRGSRDAGLAFFDKWEYIWKLGMGEACSARLRDEAPNQRVGQDDALSSARRRC
jgi:hypothetical protein